MDIDYINVRGMHFDKKMGAKVTFKRWMLLFGNHNHLIEGEAEELYYTCGGKRPTVKKSNKED